MKKLKLIFLFLLIPSLAFGWGVAGMSGGGGGGGGGGDGFVGNNNATPDYTNNAMTQTAGQMAWVTYVATTSGTIGYIHAYFATTTVTGYNVAVYNSGGTILLGDCTASDVTTGWNTFTLDSEIVIDSSTTYRLAVGQADTAGAGVTMGFDDSTIDTETRITTGVTIGDAMPSTAIGSGTTFSYALSIYADNTP